MLSDALAGAADGNPSVVMVLGVSGVGKTRLVSEFAREARAQDRRVLVGNCLELTTGDLPLGPVVVDPARSRPDAGPGSGRDRARRGPR